MCDDNIYQATCRDAKWVELIFGLKCKENDRVIFWPSDALTYGITGRVSQLRCALGDLDEETQWGMLLVS